MKALQSNEIRYYYFRSYDGDAMTYRLAFRFYYSEKGRDVFRVHLFKRVAGHKHYTSCGTESYAKAGKYNEWILSEATTCPTKEDARAVLDMWIPKGIRTTYFKTKKEVLK